VIAPSAVRTSAKPPPPIPHDDGCTTHTAAAAAIAASTAEPPARRAAPPASAASRCSVATAPSRACAGAGTATIARISSAARVTVRVS
jgi:hypothetical protein